MILQTAPAAEAVMSGVGATHAFTIKATAKSFHILSSSLYSNKIRAIQRELSTNALDSHKMAGREDVPFTVHLPTQLEPWYSIRDYGIGLDHETATGIFTTFFESTKTHSNDFNGTLGLGSKSPFSYTSNFTVTAIKMGVKNIYTAFIDGQGTPNFAPMGTETTDEPAGVEIRFSVENREDISRFRDECRSVYNYFAVKPTITGQQNFEFDKVKYTERDLIPGVHRIQVSRYETAKSRAVMSCIAYPIDVPNSRTVLGDLASLLDCGLEIHFANGELDFQPSREGLSYIDMTIQNIKHKLETLRDSLLVKFAEQADAITNTWEKTTFIVEKSHDSLWSAAVAKYVADTNYSFVQKNSGSYYPTNWEFTVHDLAAKYNISISKFSKNQYDTNAKTEKTDFHMVNTAPGQRVREDYWTISINRDTYFVKNLSKRGATAAAKYHWRNRQLTSSNEYVFVLNRANNQLPIRFKEFFAAIENPPNIITDEELDRPAAVARTGKTTTQVLKLADRKEHNRRWGRASVGDLVWRDYKASTAFDDKETHYYLPVKGFNSVSKVEGRVLKDLLARTELVGLADITILGVRKDDLEVIAKKKNWVNIEDYISKRLRSYTKRDFLSWTIGNLDVPSIVTQLGDEIAVLVANPNSVFTKTVSKFKGLKRVAFGEQAFIKLCQLYAPEVKITDTAASLKGDLDNYTKTYPMLNICSISNYGDSRKQGVQMAADYVKLVDSQA